MRLFLAHQVFCPLAVWAIRKAVACEGHRDIRSAAFWREFSRNAVYVSWAGSAAFYHWVGTWEDEGEQ